jgi:hypothetical protein
MKSENLIEKSLLELEENLKMLDSARKQVDTLSEGSERLIQAVVRLISQIESVRNVFADSRHGISRDIETATESMLSAANLYSENYKKALSDLIDESKSANSQIYKGIGDQHSKIASLLEGYAGQIFVEKNNWVEKISQLNVEQIERINRSAENYQSSIADNLEIFNKKISELSTSITVSNFQLSQSVDVAKYSLANLAEQIENTDFSISINELVSIVNIFSVRLNELDDALKIQGKSYHEDLLSVVNARSSRLEKHLYVLYFLLISGVLFIMFK